MITMAFKAVWAVWFAFLFVHGCRVRSLAIGALISIPSSLFFVAYACQLILDVFSGAF